MNNSISESRDLASAIYNKLKNEENLGVEVLVCPPFTALSEVSKVLEGSGIEVGGQNCFYESSGAFTGEISAEMLLNSGCSFVLVGHSERRTIIKESDEVVNKKLLKSLEVGLKVILCVGETLGEREAGDTLKVVERQVLAGLESVVSEDLEDLEIAYEPIWAIGTGKTATPEIAEEVQSSIRAVLEGHFGSSADVVRVLYGGSVKASNIEELMAKPSIDGALVGGASLTAEGFVGIIKGAI